MSHEHYYSAKELAGLPGLPDTLSGVIRAAKREEWPARKRTGRGGGNEYPESFLPKVTRDHLQQQRLRQCLATPAEQPKELAVVQDDLMLNDQQKLEKAARMAVLRELNRMRLEAGISLEAAIHTLLTQAKLGELSPLLARQLELARDKRGSKGSVPGVRTIKRWMTAEDLAPKRKKKDLKHPVWARDFLVCYQRPQKPSINQAYAEFSENWDGEAPSIHAVRRYLKKLPMIELEKHRLGSREIKSLKPFVRRTFDNLWPNDVWSADGHTFDAEVQHPLHGQPFRPEITGIIDIGTRYMSGFSVTLAESSLTTIDALRHACETSGIPAIFYVDNGSGYANDMLKNEAIGILSRLGIEVKHSLPYNSQARGVIERVHRTIWVSLAKTLESYMGRDMDREAGQKFHKLSRRGDANGVIRLPIGWRNFIQLCEDAIERYNHRPHSILPRFVDDNGKRRHYSPAEFRDMRMQSIEGYQHHEINSEEADSLFRPREIRTVNRGEVSLFGNKYFANVLADYHGDEIQIGYDVHDAQFVWLYDENDDFIGKAEFMGNAKEYFAKPVIEQARDKREAGRRKRAEKVLDEIEAERNGNEALEAIPAEQLPGMNTIAKKIEERMPVEMAPTIPQDSRERYLFWRDWDERAKAGEAVPESLALFIKSFPNSAVFRSWDDFYNPEKQQEKQ